MDLILYFRVSVVEAMWFLSATCGPFLSKALKDSLGTVYVFASKKLYLLLTVLYKDNNKDIMEGLLLTWPHDKQSLSPYSYPLFCILTSLLSIHFSLRDMPSCSDSLLLLFERTRNCKRKKKSYFSKSLFSPSSH